MTAFSASAPGKIILFGEHAVVYGRPAIAVPVRQVQARAVVMPDPRGERGQVHIQAPGIGLDNDLSTLPPDHPLRVPISGVLAELTISASPACTVRVTSSIPVAAGMGSGAAVSVALIRAFAAFLGHPLPVERVSGLAYEVEKLYHGTPSGIDNTVVAYDRPVYFRRGKPIEIFPVGAPFSIVIGDTGVSFATSVAVGDVRRRWQDHPQRFERLFDAAGELANEARGLIETGQPLKMGNLMTENHRLLQEMGVSSPELDRLVQAALQAGARGAKLSGGGRGGNMIALVEPDHIQEVVDALQKVGAARTWVTEVRP